MNEYFGKGDINFWVYDLMLQPFSALIPAVYPPLNTVDEIYVEYYNELLTSPYNDFRLVISPWFRVEIDTYTSNEAKPVTALLGKVIIWILHLIWWGVLALISTKLWISKNVWLRRVVMVFIFAKLILNGFVFFPLSFF